MADRFSRLGNPVVGALEFQATGDTGRRTPGLVINAVLIDVSRQHNVVVTAVSGRSGTVKELTGVDDWAVEIKGTLIAQGREEMQALKNTLLAILNAQRALPISNAYLTDLGIYNLVVQSYRLPMRAGQGFLRQDFEISGLSDAPVELDG